MTSLVQALPPNTKTLDLSKNKLWRLQAQGLCDILGAMQTGVTTLILDDNELHTVPYLVSALECMPDHIQKLSLDRNYWGHVPFEAFLAVMSSIPEHVTAISLRNNGLSLHPSRLMSELRALKPGCDLDFSNNRLTSDVENTMIALSSTSEYRGLKALGNDLLLTVFTFLIPVNTTIRNDFFRMTEAVLNWKPSRDPENNRITNIPYARTAEEIDREYEVPRPVIAVRQEIAQKIPPIMPHDLQSEIRLFRRRAEQPNRRIHMEIPQFLIDLLSHPMIPVVSVVLLLAAAAAITAGYVVVAGIAAASGAALLAGHLR